MRNNYLLGLLAGALLVGAGTQGSVQAASEAAREDWSPRITKTKEKGMSWFEMFDDSTTLLRANRRMLERSTDNGEHWSSVPDVSGTVMSFDIDENYPHDRAFAFLMEESAMYVTDDQGSSWKKGKVEIPPELYSGEQLPHCYVQSHAADRNMLVMGCQVCRKLTKEELEESKKQHQKEKDSGNSLLDDLVDDIKEIFVTPPYTCETVVLKSANAGKSFDMIKTPYKLEDSKRADVLHLGSSCRWARQSRDSKITVDEATLICEYEKVLHSTTPGMSMRATSQLFTVVGNNVQKIDFFKDMTVNAIEVLDSYIVVLTQEDKFNDNSNKKIWISKDAKTFQESYIPTNLNFNQLSMFIFEDNFGRIVMPVKKVDYEPMPNSDNNDNDNNNNDEDYQNSRPGRNMPSRRNFQYSEVLVSDSTGLKFDQYNWIDKNTDGFTTVEPIKFLKGTIMNTFFSMMAPFRHNGDKNEAKKLVASSKVSFDNGVSWNPLKVVDPENKEKYICNIDDPESCSIVSLNNFNNWEVPSAGILLVSGALTDGFNYEHDNERTFLSRDGGQTWKKVLDFPSISIVGDSGNVILAIPYDAEADGDPQSEIFYSLDQGETWSEYELEETIFPAVLINTTPDGSGSTFILEGFENGNHRNMPSDGPGTFFYTIDFSDAFKGKKCQRDDFETFYLNDGKCINGAKYSYRRRKANAKCLVGEVFTDLELDEEICLECTDADYECTFEFSKDDQGNCVPDTQLMGFSGICEKNQNKKINMASKQKIQGNKCKKELPIKKIDVPCGTSSEPTVGTDKIAVTETSIDGQIKFYQYFDSDEDETVIIANSRYEFFISHDGGKTIKKIDTQNEKIIEVVFHRFSNSSAYLFTSSGSIFVTNDRGYTFTSRQLPEALQLGFPLNFHPTDLNTFIYYGGKGCSSMFNPECRVVSYITRDGGLTFEEMLDNAVHCEFTGALFEHPANKNMVTCQVRDVSRGARSLVTSNDYFKTDKKVIFEKIIGYMTSGGYSVVAVSHENKQLRAYVTMDGEEYAEAKLPQDLSDLDQKTFTVLGTNAGSIFLHMGTSSERSFAYGDLLKSNSNGTSFVTLQKDVNSNRVGQADFEKIKGLEGIILINTVENAENAGSNDKKLKTKITFNDGADWEYLSPPAKDSEGKKYKCKSGSLEKCSLNLHGYTERQDVRDTYSSGSAHGMMFGVGNVGEYLLPTEEASTFLTTDGGLTWKEVKKGAHQWEFGDHGGILVLVPEGGSTDTISYSLDFGNTWNEHKFSNEKVTISDIVTVPQDSSLRFLLIGQVTNVNGAKTKVYSLDFTGSFKRQCDFVINNNKKDDFAFVSIAAPQNECLFGHKEEYLKKIKSDCFVGSIPLSKFTRITKNCTCTRNDFECDYNYVKSKDGTCKLIEGLSPIAPSDICKKNPDLIEFSDPTGYRKIPLSTCQGGLKLDVSSDTYPCPGKEELFNEKYGISGRSFLMMFFIPFVLFVIFLWFVYDRGIRRNGGFARFGEIRLGDENQLIENNETDRVVNTIVKGGLVLFSGMHAGFELLKRGMRSFSQRFGGPLSSRRGPSYSSLMNDQFLDEADDLLAGHDEDANDLSSFMDQDTNFDIDEESNIPSDNEVSNDVPQHPYTDDVESDEVPAALVNDTTDDTSAPTEDATPDVDDESGNK